MPARTIVVARIQDIGNAPNRRAYRAGTPVVVSIAVGMEYRSVEWLREFHAACVAGESEPNSSTPAAFRSLRHKLEARPRARSGRGRVGRSWTRWVIAAQLAVIVVLGGVVIVGDDFPAVYRTLGSGNANAVTTGSLVVVFDPATTEADLRRMLRDIGARLIDGPTRTNAYVLEVPETRREQAVRVLRNERAVVL